MKWWIRWGIGVGLCGGLGCSESLKPLEQNDKEVCLEGRGGERYCIDLYEASRDDASDTSVGMDDLSPPKNLENRLPWNQVTFEEAQEACSRAGRRLCTRSEWVDACDGGVGEEEGTVFVYGDELENGPCNTTGEGLEPGGTFTECASVDGTFDQNGNVWEWVTVEDGPNAAFGGSFRTTSRLHACNQSAPSVSPAAAYEDVGFRCCRDPDA